MNETEVKEVTEVATTDNVEVTAVEKETFGTKIKNGAKKVFSSKPAKIVGGVLLAAGGAVVGYSYAKRDQNDDTDFDFEDDGCYDEDFDEVPAEDESSDIAD